MYLFPKYHRQIRKLWAKYQVAMLGSKIEIKGVVDKDAKLFLINHRSMYDIIVIESIVDNDPCWVAKKEISDIPWFGRINDVPKMISIDREDKNGLIKLLKDAKQRLQEGRVIMIFPEGTRSKTDKLLKFKMGAKILSQKYNLKIQPIVIKNSEKALDTQEHKVNKTTVKISFLKSFTPDKNNKEWLNNLRDEMQKEYDIL